MNDGLFVGVDVGTYETKGVVVDGSGSLVASVARPHELLVPRAGWAEHDAERDWWGATSDVIRKLLAEPGVDASKVRAVGCSAIGPCVVPVDQQGRAMRKGILYGIDTRATAEIEGLNELYGEERIFVKGGNALTTQSVGPKILWLARNEPEIYREAHKFVTSTSFVVARLTGEYVMDHYTAAGYTPLYDIEALAWSEELAGEIVELDRLPRLAWSNEIAGRVTAQSSRETGLPEATPVITGTVDAAAEAVSAGVVSPEQMMLMYGTTLFMIQVVDRPMYTPMLWAAPYLFPGTHGLMAGMATTGALTRWIRDQFARELVQAEDEGGESAYGRLSEAAAQVPPGSEGLVCLPYFSGERTPIQDPRARGVFFGLSLAHKRAHLYRAAMEGVGFGIRHHLEIMEELGTNPHQLLAVGGGTKNRQWLQAVSDITSRVQDVPVVTVGASYGDAFLAYMAWQGRDDYKSAIAEWVKPGYAVQPDESQAGNYSELYGVYRQLYERTKDLMAISDRVGGATRWVS